MGGQSSLISNLEFTHAWIKIAISLPSTRQTLKIYIESPISVNDQSELKPYPLSERNGKYQNSEKINYSGIAYL